jgi:hypothetical protein
MIYHVVEQHGAAGERIERAQASWKLLYDRGMVPVHKRQFEFTSAALGDNRALPLLTEILSGMSAVGDGGIVMLTNDDTILHPALPALLDATLARQGAVGSFRINVDRPVGPLLGILPKAIAKSHWPDYGRDLFAFTGKWLYDNWPSIPMMFLGEMEWDIVMMILIRKTLGIVTQKTQELHHRSAGELPLGYVLHEQHETLWKAPSFARNTAKEWNRTVAKGWYDDHGMNHLCTV